MERHHVDKNFVNGCMQNGRENSIFSKHSENKTTYEPTAQISLQQKEDVDEENDELPAPPDGGYGWVVVAASFACNMVVDGIAYTFGIFLFEIIDYYGETKGKTAWVGSLLSGTYMSVGPLVSALCNKFGCREVCIAGSIISTIAFTLSIYSPSVSWLMFTYGFLGGLGFGFIYLPAVVCVGYYFETKRSLATGIAVCGSGVGTFAFAPLATILLNNYGWKGANMILAGIIFNCAIFGALMRPLEYPKKKTPKHKENQLYAKYSSNSHTELRKRNDSGSLSNKNIHNEVDAESLAFTSKSSLASRKEASHVIHPLTRKDIFYSGSVQHLAEFQSQKSLADYRHSIASIPHMIPHPYTSRKTCSCLPESVRNSLAQVIDISLLKDPVFMFIGISNLFAMAGLYVPFVYMVDCAKADGIDAGSASFLLSLIGITNTIGRIACGYFTDFPQVNTLFVNNMCLVLGAVSVGFIPFCHTYAAYAMVAILFAIAVSGYISLSSIILVDLLGLDKLTNAFGLMILFRGAAALIGSPIAGALYDATKSYNVTFYVAGTLFGIAALLSFLAPCMKRFSHEEKQVLREELKPINEEKENYEDEVKDTTA